MYTYANVHIYVKSLPVKILITLLLWQCRYDVV